MSMQAAESRKEAPSVAKLRPQDGQSSPLSKFRQEMDKLFDGFVQSFSGSHRSPEIHPAWKIETIFGNALPAVNFAEDDKTYSVTVELPGMDEKDIDISLVGRTLTIKGEKSEANEEKKKGYYLAERRFGSFERAFQLPEDADCDSISAKCDKGLLSLIMAKSAKALPPSKKIDIKAA